MRQWFSRMRLRTLNFGDCNVIHFRAVGHPVIDVDCMKLIKMSSYNLPIPPLVVEQHVTMFTYNKGAMQLVIEGYKFNVVA